MTRHVACITGTRADYGLMRPVFRAIQNDPALELTLLVTGMHFHPDFAESLVAIRQDAIGTRIELPVFDTVSDAASMATTLGKHIEEITKALQQLKPDILLLQGDRGEMLAGAIAAAHLNILIVHMSGGDRSGTIDDSIRHAITKFAHFHLPTCDDSRKNLLAMGEEDMRIQIVGEPALDIIKSFKPLPKDTLLSSLGLSSVEPFILVAQHPVTTECENSREQITETLESVLSAGMQALITGPNSDSGGAEMTKTIHEYVQKHPDRLKFCTHLGQERFFSLMHYAAVMVGNTSAGILESSSFKLPVVNIGTRQHSRVRAANVIDAGYHRAEIGTAIQKTLKDEDFKRRVQACINPYGAGDTSEKTVSVLKSLRLNAGLISKWIKGYQPL